MRTLARILILLFLAGLFAFCIFGFLASGEVEGEARLKWRMGYSLVGLAVLAGIVVTAKGFGTKPD